MPSSLQTNDFLIRQLQREVQDLRAQVNRYNFSRSQVSRRDVLISSKFNYIDVGSRIYSVPVGGDIQAALTNAGNQGGGIVRLVPGTHSPSKNITIPSYVLLEGIGTGATVDFGNGAFQFQMASSNNYTAGTISVTNGGTTVTGVGTTFTSAMVGRYILLEDYFYKITAFTDTTHIEVTAYAGATLSGATYVIATTIQGATIKDLTIQNSSIALVKTQGTDFCAVKDCTLDTGLAGIDGDDSSFPTIDGCSFFNCTTGIDADNFHGGTLINTSLFANGTGGGMDFNTCRNWAMQAWVVQDSTGRGAAFTSCSNMGLEDWSIRNTDGIGMEFVSGNSLFSILDFLIENGGSDGVKLTATTNGLSISAGSLKSNVGYGVNVASADCNRTMIFGNDFISNTAGTINDLGTGTITGLNGDV